MRPYAIRVVVAAETRSAPTAAVSRAISEHLEHRAAAVVGPVWRLTTTVASTAERAGMRRAIRHRDIRHLPAAAADPDEGVTPEQEPEQEEEGRGDGAADPSSSATAFEPRLANGFDKLVLVLVEETPVGFAVASVEYDNYVRRLGPTQRVATATAAETREAAFQAICGGFAPVAVFSIDRKDYRRAELRFRGAGLPRPPGSPPWGQAGDVFQPIIRQSDREGNVPPSGIREAPWTLLHLTDAGAGEASALVVSHTRRPFGARRRGRVEQLAIRLTPSGRGTRLRLHARDDASRPLVGYHVFARDTAEGELLPLGASDNQGVVRIPRVESPIRTLFVKSGSKLVAKLPIAPGTSGLLQAPLVDESKRIEAEARLSLLREELIDLVARRAILVSRTRSAIDGEDYAKARGFVADLESLPGLNVFNQRLTEQEQLSRARDPAVQERIDALFEQMRGVLGAFLSSREITQLRREVESAADKKRG